ncbi:MAG TPA: folate family ECF transporter S component [Feifaniaceae bacterium]|nr:folate family ECF transporter S component [Feifaniaceae bacterium]
MKKTIDKPKLNPFFTPKRLTLMAMLIALQIILSKFLMLQLTDSIRLSIDSVPILLAGLWFGPVAGGVVGALADLLGTVLFPTAGAYFPLLTVAFFLIGAVSGLLSLTMRNRPAFLRAIVCVIPAELIGSFLFKSFALSTLYGIPFLGMLAARALPVSAVAVVNTLLVSLLDRLIGVQARSAVFAKKTPPVQNASLPQGTMNYEQALSYIHQVAWRGSRLGLERTNELLERIGNPHRALKFVHIAGTNGKGSTAAMLARILTSAGYRTGLYISPFINRFNERMQVDGEPIGDEELAGITSYVRPFADAMADHPTEFELITVIGFEFFLRRNVDIVILEVGMGGLLDSTNVIDTPELAIITNIGLDHTRELGPTIPDIARAKAGIIKPGGDVLIYDQNAEADAVFEETCHQMGARLTVTDHARITNVSHSLDALTFDCAPYGRLTCGLVGSYQTHNAAVVITAVKLLRKKGWQISTDALKTGLASVLWPARFEVLLREPVFIADGGHNPQGITAAAESLIAHFPNRKITFLIGIMADKDIPHMIEQLGPLAQDFVTVTPNNPRAMHAEELAELLRSHGQTAVSCQSVQEGVSKALELAGSDGIVCALGSLYLLGDVRAALGVK